MIEKIMLAMQGKVLGMANSEKDFLTSLSTDQLNQLRHECGNIKPNAPASMRLAVTILDAVAEAILNERKNR